MTREIHIDGRDCRLTTVGEQAAAQKLVILLPGERDIAEKLPEITSPLARKVESGECRPFVLAGFDSDAWEADFTPWAAPRLFKKSADFPGGAGDTLRWVQASFLPEILAQSGAEGGGWAAYMATRHPPPGSRVYLSLGKNEEHAKNQRMATVGDVTRQAAALYENSPYTAEAILQWNEGGHFDDIPGRLARALAWMAKN